MTKAIRTYGDLLNALMFLTEEQRAQPIQIVPNDEQIDGTKVVTPMHAFAIGTVDECGFAGWRNSDDNKYHGEDIAILADDHAFSEEGVIAYNLTHGDEPIYGKDGPTQLVEQLRPAW